MSSTSISLGEHFEGYLASQVNSGLYGNKSEVIRDALRDHEEKQRKIEALRQALIAGEESGPHSPLDMDKIIAAARLRAGLDA